MLSPYQREKNNDRDRHAEQPKQDSASHEKLPSSHHDRRGR
jgi:hypothetical protein